MSPPESGPPDPRELGRRLVALVADAVADQDSRHHVVEVAKAPSGADVALAMAWKSDPVFLLAPSSLVQQPIDRLRALMRLLDAAEVAGAVVAFDVVALDGADDAAIAGLAARLRTLAGTVVLTTPTSLAPGPLAAVLTTRTALS